MSTRPERIAVVAAGVVTPIGQDLDTFWSGLLTGVDGTSAVERFPVGDLRVGRGGEIKKLTRAGGLAARARLPRDTAARLGRRRPLRAGW